MSAGLWSSLTLLAPVPSPESWLKCQHGNLDFCKNFLIGLPVFALAPSHVFPLAIVVLFQKYYFKNVFSVASNSLMNL